MTWHLVFHRVSWYMALSPALTFCFHILLNLLMNSSLSYGLFHIQDLSISFLIVFLICSKVLIRFSFNCSWHEYFISNVLGILYHIKWLMMPGFLPLEMVRLIKWVHAVRFWSSLLTSNSAVIFPESVIYLEAIVWILTPSFISVFF